jgi:colanic acid/amylovoran biosynthesis protein
MKWLITNNNSSANRGDAAILQGLIEMIKDCDPKADFYTFSNYPDVAAKIHGLKGGISYLRVYSRKRLPFDLGKFFMLYVWSIFRRYLKIDAKFIFSKKAKDYLAKIDWADCVISVGGAYINDNYRPGTLGRLLELYFIKRVQKPVLLIGHSIGPFNVKFYRYLASFILNRVDLITTRDKSSLLQLRDIGVVKPTIVQTADTAFYLVKQFGLPQKEIDKLWTDEGITANQKKIVTVSVRKWGFFEKGAINSHEIFVEKMAEICDRVIMNTGAQIVFLSTCTDLGGYAMDDRKTAQQVIGKMKLGHSARIFMAELTPLELISVYQRASMHIGTRMHSNILAMMAGVPCVGIAYEFKTKDLFEMMGLSDFVADINNFDEDNLSGIIMNAWKQRDSLRRKVRKSVELQYKKTQEYISLIKNYVR